MDHALPRPGTSPFGDSRVTAAVVVLSCLPWLALLAWLSSLAWFMTDDAFITFRYVRNLLEGHGLVFNPGERVEGYSNFLWALELAALWKLFGLPPEDVAQWLSVGYTVGVIAVVLWWVRRDGALRHRGLAGWMVLGLVCGSATFAVWTSGGGLETRQFTFFIMAAMVSLMLHNGSRRGLLAASLCLAGAALTRPEGVLMAACCFGWFGLQRMLAGRHRRVGADGPASGRLHHRRWAGWLDWREIAWLTAPFVVLVAAHLLFRLAYYGEWLPNTYHAKFVRPWYVSGIRYYLAAMLETGLWLLVPLAFVALREGWRARREVTYVLPLLCIFVHAVGVTRVGGDHFEYRPLDFYWPALAVPVVAAMLELGSRLSGARLLRRLVPSRPGLAGRACSLAIFVPVLFYSSAIQGVLLWEGSKVRSYSTRMHFELDEENAKWLLAVPGMSVLVPISNDLRRLAAHRFVALRFPEHRENARYRIPVWSPYENMERGLIPDDALSTRDTIGIPCYYLPDLRFIDHYGLTDATIARNPVDRPNYKRVMAHDRRPPHGYLEERGVNLFVAPPATSETDALQRADFAVQVGPDLWMPFDTLDHDWTIEHFSELGLAQKFTSNENEVEQNRLRVDGRLYVGERFIGNFKSGFDGWTRIGEAISNHDDHTDRKGRILRSIGSVGAGYLTSFHPDRKREATGFALSPEFTARSEQYLFFLIAGSTHGSVGVRLLADGVEAGSWQRPRAPLPRTWFRTVVRPLSDVAGKSLQLVFFDQNSSRGFAMLDHVMLMRPAFDDSTRHDRDPHPASPPRSSVRPVQ